MFYNYEEIKQYFDNLNLDKSHFNTTNDICTPMGCVKEMVDAIPDEFWHKENLKILDPCAGNGNFPAYLALKAPLNSIYCNEINPIRATNLKTYFENKINFTSIDFLTFPESEKYDLIIANPPYAKFVASGQRAAKNHGLSRDFIKKAYKLLKNDGYLVFIIPDNWMSWADRNDLPKLLTVHKIHVLNIGEAKHWFPGVGSSFTYFIIQKSAYDASFKTKIIMPDSVEYTNIQNNIPCIPLKYNEIIKGLFQKVVFNTAEKYPVKTSSNLHKYTKAVHLSATKTEKFSYRIIHTPNQTVWSDIPHIYQNGWKVFLPTTTYYHPYVDNDCGMTQSIAFILCDTENMAIQYRDELNEKVYKVIVDLTRYGNFNNQRVLQNLSKRDTFVLTPEEEEFINNYNVH